MYASWTDVFPDANDVATSDRREWELREFPESPLGSPPPTVIERIGPDGDRSLQVRPPRFGPGIWVVGTVLGILLSGCGVAILFVPAGGEATVGSVLGGLGFLVSGVGFALLMLSHERHWIFDRRGVHRVTGLGRRSTPWSEIARLRLVVLGHGGGGNTSRRLVRLHFLDASGRSVTELPHVSRGVRPHRWSAETERDVEALRYVAGECHRRGWSTGVAEHRRAGNEEGITALMQAAAHDADEVDRLIADGADMGARDSEGLTALHWAAAWGDPEAVRRLVAAGAEVDARTPYGYTPLRLAESLDRPTVLALRDAGGSGELPPFGPVRFAASHWRPVMATYVPAVVVPTVCGVAAWFLFLGGESTVLGGGLVFLVGIVTLLVLRMLRPLMFWSGGVPTAQVEGRLMLRTPWGGRRDVDLDRVVAAVRTPPIGYRAGRVHGSAILLVVESGGWRLTAERINALRLDHRRERLLAAGSRAVLVVVDPCAESSVVAAMVPRLMAARADVGSELHDLLTADVDDV